MTRFVVEVLPDAEREFRGAFVWYLRPQSDSRAFRTQVLESIDDLADRADMGPADDDGFHFHVLDRFSYTVWYDVNGQVATVMAIAHQHRRPNCWKTRG